jgi:hypothetical protein
VFPLLCQRITAAISDNSLNCVKTSWVAEPNTRKELIQYLARNFYWIDFQVIVCGFQNYFHDFTPILNNSEVFQRTGHILLPIFFLPSDEMLPRGFLHFLGGRDDLRAGSGAAPASSRSKCNRAPVAVDRFASVAASACSRHRQCRGGLASAQWGVGGSSSFAARNLRAWTITGDDHRLVWRWQRGSDPTTYPQKLGTARFYLFAACSDSGGHLTFVRNAIDH